MRPASCTMMPGNVMRTAISQPGMKIIVFPSGAGRKRRSYSRRRDDLLRGQAVLDALLVLGEVLRVCAGALARHGHAPSSAAVRSFSSPVTANLQARADATWACARASCGRAAAASRALPRNAS